MKHEFVGDRCQGSGLLNGFNDTEFEAYCSCGFCGTSPNHWDARQRVFKHCEELNRPNNGQKEVTGCRESMDQMWE